MILCAGKSEQFDFAQPIGIGMVESAVNLSRLFTQKKPDHVVFVGTAGSYGEKEIFEIIESRTAANVEQSFFAGDSYTPIDNVVSLSPQEWEQLQPARVASLHRSGSNPTDDKQLSSASRVSRETIVNSSNYITTNEAVWQHYRAQHIHIENMEFFAVMKTAQMYGIPAAGIFIVTNYCNKEAHEDFKKNHAEAMKRLSDYVKARATA